MVNTAVSGEWMHVCAAARQEVRKMHRKALVRVKLQKMPRDTRLGAFNESCRYDKPLQLLPCSCVPSTFMLQLMISSQRSARPFEQFVLRTLIFLDDILSATPLTPTTIGITKSILSIILRTIESIG
jgi:hypothetical protein